MKNVREIAFERAFEIFMHAGIVYFFYSIGKTWLLRKIKGEKDINSIEKIKYWNYLIWFIISAIISTLWYFTQGADRQAAINSLTAFKVICLSTLFGTYMAFLNEKDNLKKGN